MLRGYWGCVYVARRGALVKIGFTENLTARLRQLRVDAHGERVDVLGTVQCAAGVRTYALERTVHARFEHLRVRGEWFRDDPSIHQWLAEISTDFCTGRG